MTDQEREAIRARLAAATPWHEWSNGPDDVRTLLAEVERLTGTVAIAPMFMPGADETIIATKELFANADRAKLLDAENARLRNREATLLDEGRLEREHTDRLQKENARLRDKTEELKHKDHVWRKVYDAAAAERDEARAEARQWANTAQEMLQEREAIKDQLARAVGLLRTHAAVDKEYPPVFPDAVRDFIRTTEGGDDAK